MDTRSKKSLLHSTPLLPYLLLSQEREGSTPRATWQTQFVCTLDLIFKRAKVSKSTQDTHGTHQPAGVSVGVGVSVGYGANGAHHAPARSSLALRTFAHVMVHFLSLSFSLSLYKPQLLICNTTNQGKENVLNALFLSFVAELHIRVKGIARSTSFPIRRCGRVETVHSQGQ